MAKVNWALTVVAVAASCWATFSRAISCYDCTSWNPYCREEVENPFPEAVAIVECNITNTCFIRKEKNGVISRGCADWWVFSAVVADYRGCQKQTPQWMGPQEWCFCDAEYCNGKSMNDVNLTAQTARDDKRLPIQITNLVPQKTTRRTWLFRSWTRTPPLPWWRRYVHWSTTQRPSSKRQEIEDASIEGKASLATSTEPSPWFPWWFDKNDSSAVSAQGPTLPRWWKVPAVPTGPARDRQNQDKTEDSKRPVNPSKKPTSSLTPVPALKENERNDISDFYCWDCFSEDPFCGDVVRSPVSYYVGRVPCPVTNKCFVRKDGEVIYRGCADGWIRSSITNDYVGCKTQTIWDRPVEWCFCSTPFCNSNSIEGIKSSHSETSSQ